jgi:hypothetical protein
MLRDAQTEPAPMICRIRTTARLAALGLALLCGNAVIHAAPPAGDLVQDLSSHGITFPSGETVALPTAQMPDDLDVAAQQEALRRAAGKYPLDRFVRNAIVSPFDLEMNSIEDASGARHGQRLDFCFVAYGTLEAIIRQDLFGALAGAQDASGDDSDHTTARALTAAELQARDLAPEKTAEREESYLLVNVPILNRVQLRGVGFAVREKRPESIVAGIKLDERFNKGQEFSNTWSPLLRDKSGKLTEGAAKPYSGLGGYMKITQLQQPAGALFVECHIAFAEPEAWFDGKNLLRSKLPLVVQDNVRSFRRKLAEDSSTK